MNVARAATSRAWAIEGRAKSYFSPEPHLVIVGDSFVQGVGASWRRYGYAHQLAQRLPATVTALGAGGTGFITGCENGSHYAGRLRHIALAAPTHLLVQASMNDRFSSENEIGDAMRSFLLPVRRLVNRVALTGPFWSARTDELLRIRGVAAQVARDAGVAWIDPKTWIADATAHTLMNPDRAHPSDAGHTVLADQLEQPLADFLRV